MSSAATESRRDREVRARREFIVEATRELIASGGVEGTSMDDIAAAVQYTRRTLYSYFRSRDEILLKLFEVDTRERWAIQRAAVDQVPGFREKLETWGETLFEFVRHRPACLRLQAYWDYHGIDPAKIGPDLFRQFEELNDELADGLRAMFEGGIREGSLRPDLPVDLCVSQFLYGLRVAIHRALSPTYSFTTFDPDAYVTHYLDHFWRGIRAEEPAP